LIFNKLQNDLEKAGWRISYLD